MFSQEVRIFQAMRSADEDDTGNEIQVMSELLIRVGSDLEDAERLCRQLIAARTQPFSAYLFENRTPEAVPYQDQGLVGFLSQAQQLSC